MDRNELKIQALLERITQQEHQVADLRAELTMTGFDRDQLREQLDALSNANATETQTDEVVHEITDLSANVSD